MRSVNGVPHTLAAEIANYYHIARTALADQPSVPTRYERMNYAVRWLMRNHPELNLSPGEAWDMVNRALSDEVVSLP